MERVIAEKSPFQPSEDVKRIPSIDNAGRRILFVLDDENEPLCLKFQVAFVNQKKRSITIFLDDNTSLTQSLKIPNWHFVRIPQAISYLTP